MPTRNCELVRVDPFKGTRDRINGERPPRIEFEVDRFDLERLGSALEVSIVLNVFIEEAKQAGYRVQHGENMARNSLAFLLDRPEDAVAVIRNPLADGAIDV